MLDVFSRQDVIALARVNIAKVIYYGFEQVDC